jgi:hypothetical protein
MWADMLTERDSSCVPQPTAFSQATVGAAYQ